MGRAEPSERARELVNRAVKAGEEYARHQMMDDAVEKAGEKAATHRALLDYIATLEARREWERRSKPLTRTTRLSRGEGLRPVNRERKKKRRERDFGDKADFIREQPCDTCGAPPPSDPSHYPSRGAGGTKENLFPQCRDCHDEMHHYGVETFLAERLIQPKDVEWLVGVTEHWEARWQEHKEAA